MQRTDARRLTRRTLIVLTTLLMTFTLVQVVLAAAPPYESTTVSPFTADLVDFWYDYHSGPSGPSTSTWVYAVTLTEEVDLTNALSHVSLGLGTCGVSQPLDAAVYVSPLSMVTRNYGEVCLPDANGIYTCTAGSYTIERGAMQSGQPVVKFETLGEGLNLPGQTHILVVQVEGAVEGSELPTGTFVATKNGDNLETSTLTGPYCESTAVEVTSLSAGTSAQMPIIILGLVAAAGATGTTLFKEIKRRD